VLNKFNVVEHHVLILTRTFEHQSEPLTLADFEALWICMAGFDALGFYNSGTIAGASQPHKHLQLVPLPLAPDGPPTPVDPVIERVLSATAPGPIPGESDGEPAGLPFPHALAAVEPGAERDPAAAARRSLEQYRELMRRCGLGDDVRGGPGTRTRPYNLLLTRRWMMVVPRARECFGPISVNALGFAGALLARNPDELALLRSRGPMTALREVAGIVPASGVDGPHGAAAPGSPSPGPNDCSAR
jgi:ATP adenylyltransferase